MNDVDGPEADELVARYESDVMLRASRAAHALRYATYLAGRQRGKLDALRTQNPRTAASQARHVAKLAHVERMLAKDEAKQRDCEIALGHMLAEVASICDDGPRLEAGASLEATP